MDFNGARDDMVALASAGPYANHLHTRSRQTTMPVPYHSDRMPFLLPNQQCQSTEGYFGKNTDTETVLRV